VEQYLQQVGSVNQGIFSHVLQKEVPIFFLWLTDTAILAAFLIQLALQLNNWLSKFLATRM